MNDMPSEIIDRALAVYLEVFRTPAFTGGLDLSEWYSLFPAEFPEVITRYNWPDDYPNKGRPGVYFFFDQRFALLYVGQTERDIQRRLGDHVTWAKNRSGPC